MAKITVHYKEGEPAEEVFRGVSEEVCCWDGFLQLTSETKKFYITKDLIHHFEIRRDEEPEPPPSP